MTCRPPLFSPEPRLRVWSQLHTAERKGGKRYSLETCEREGREKKPSITNFLHSDCLQKEKKKKKEKKRGKKKSLRKEPVLKQPDLCRVPVSRSVLLAEEAPKNPRRETKGFHSPRQQQHSCYGDHQASFTPLPHFSPAYVCCQCRGVKLLKVASLWSGGKVLQQIPGCPSQDRVFSAQREPAPAPVTPRPDLTALRLIGNDSLLSPCLLF